MDYTGTSAFPDRSAGFPTNMPPPNMAMNGMPYGCGPPMYPPPNFPNYAGLYFCRMEKSVNVARKRELVLTMVLEVLCLNAARRLL